MKKEEEFEHEIGSIKFVKKSIDTIKLLSASIKELDPDEANLITDTLNQIVVNQHHRKHDHDKKRTKRHKTIFDEY